MHIILNSYNALRKVADKHRLNFVFVKHVVQLEMAEQCLTQAMDLSGLLLLYSALGDSDGITKLSSLAKEQGKNNVAFLCLFMLGKLEDCLQLLVDR